MWIDSIITTPQLFFRFSMFKPYISLGFFFIMSNLFCIKKYPRIEYFVSYIKRTVDSK